SFSLIALPYCLPTHSTLFRTDHTAAGVRQDFESPDRNTPAADLTDPVLAAVEAAERPLDLRQFGADRVIERVEYLIVFALDHLFFKIRGERLVDVPHVAGNSLKPVPNLVRSRDQLLFDCVILLHISLHCLA